MITSKDENVRLYQLELQPWAVWLQSNSVHEQCSNAQTAFKQSKHTVYWLYNNSSIIATVNTIPFNIVLLLENN